MSKDQTYGFAIFIISVLVAIVYVVAFFSKSLGLDPSGTWQQWAIGLPVLLFVLLVLVISGWIGWTMLTTPPPAPLDTGPTPTQTETESKPAESKTTTSRRRSRASRRKK